MNKLSPHLPRLSAGLLAAFLIVLAARGYAETTMLFVLGSLLMFGLCWASAVHLLGMRATGRFMLAALVIGWLAEELGATRGWFFGSYAYTEVLGPHIGAVPAVIPLMWFALCYAGHVIANLIVWQAPHDVRAGPARDGLMALVGATVVTCYDLGADPYMVYKARAWIMRDKDGAWFGETAQGFAGWMLVAFAILFVFRLSMRTRAHEAAPAALPFTPRHVVTPLAMYAGLMLFQVFLGYPVETRCIALFAMGFPLLTAGCGVLRWHQARQTGPAGAVQRDAAAPTRKEAA
jgi:uncharacterized membrane protein